MSMVTPPDTELWLTGYLRSQLADVPGLQVDVSEPPGYDGSYPLIVVNDAGGAQSERILFYRSIGVTVRGWNRSRPKPCKDLARRIYAILTANPEILEGHAPDSRILAIDESNCLGPYPVTEDADIARYYSAFAYTFDGETN
jgi:hypothetical protein